MIFIFAIAALLACAVLSVLVMVLAGIRREERHMSLTHVPHTHSAVAVRLILGVYVRQPEEISMPARREQEVADAPYSHRLS